MTKKLCPYCGTPLNKINFGRYFCPNCGIIDEEKEIIKEDRKQTYIQ